MLQLFLGTRGEGSSSITSGGGGVNTVGLYRGRHRVTEGPPVLVRPTFVTTIPA